MTDGKSVVAQFGALISVAVTVPTFAFSQVLLVG